MSIFAFPRIHVCGRHYFNPGTGNNNSASPGTELTVTSDSERVRAMTLGKTDEQFRAWMKELDKDGMLRCQWNYFGDMTFRFVDVRVRSVQLGYGYPITDKAKEPLIGGQLSLNNAMLIDTNPEGFHTTQVFSEALEITAPDAIGGTGSFVSRKPTCGTTRWLNWFRNVSYHGRYGLPPTGMNGHLSSGAAGGASAAFCIGIRTNPCDLMPVQGTAPAENDEVFHKFLARPESPAMVALAAALADEERVCGLMFRFNLYLCYPSYSDTELAARFARGELTENPACGQLVGTIAPWYRGEPSTIPLGRYLKPATSYPNPYRQGKPYYLSPAIAHYDKAGEHVSLELSNCLPEDGPEGIKYDLGEVALGIRKVSEPNEKNDPDPAKNENPVIPIGPVPNTRETYQDCGGMWDVSTAKLSKADAAKLEDNDYELVLTTGKAGVLLHETEYFAVTDCGCSYLDELPPGQTWEDDAAHPKHRRKLPPALRGEIDLWVRQRGRIPSGPVTMTIEQWSETPTGMTDPASFGKYLYPLLQHCETVTVHGGRHTYRLRPLDGPGLRLFRIVPQGTWPEYMSGEDFCQLQAQEFYFELRMLPFDDYSKVADEDLTFDFIYQEILRYYHLIFPAMSKRLDMSDATIWNTPTAARYVLRMSDPELWEHFHYMPRTRDISKCRRELLRRFCHKVLKSHGVPVA